MSSEIFRFVTVRPPQQADPRAIADGVIDLGRSKSALADALRKVRISGTRSGMVRLAADFTASTDFVDSAPKLGGKLAEFVGALHQLPDEQFWAAAKQAFEDSVGGTPASFVKTEAFTTSYARTSDSIVAALIDSSVSPSGRALLVRSARAIRLIRRLADASPLTRSAFLGAPLMVPAGIFPLPVGDVDLKERRLAQATAARAALDARQKRLAQLAANLESHHQATSELMNAFEQMGAQPSVNQAARQPATAGLTTRAGFLLSDTAVSSLSDSTRAVLQSVGVADSVIDVAKSVTLLERRSAGVASQLYANDGRTGVMVRIGNTFVPGDALAGGPAIFADPGPEIRSPGPCPPVIDTTPPDTNVTVPTGYGEARILGIADLMVVEQELLRYQLGEIAHIENVLRSEARSRKFKTTDTIQQTQVTESETTTAKEQDLSSTERFELQTESQTVISSNASLDAGLTVHASYGPSVDATATFNASSSTSSQQSNTASSNYAREIATKAVERVQTRTLTRRTVTTTHVIEETNRHAFDNKTGTSDIVGVYRFLDKIYQAQVVNYGKRLMLEFIVPEPAAFLRYALTHKPNNEVSQINPEPPGYCVANGASFAPLQAADITRDNYLYWASKYGAQDVAAAPSSLAIASGSKKSPDAMQMEGDRIASSDMFDVDIPDGYLCQSAFVNLYGETQAGEHRIVFQLQEQQGTYVEPTDDNQLYLLHLQPTPKLSVSLNSAGFHNYEVLVTVFCTLSPERLQDWQLKTFSSIMNAYNDLKSAYDQAVREARLQAADFTIGGTNPGNNRITEQTELKKGCLSLLTGQRFELFDAVARNVGPFGYPEIDFAEARAEGAYIQMFEQSFEWNNMVYLFYPYFWGKKSDWTMTAQLTDDDPLFGQFLRAGAARVQVPVRRGFEDSMLAYLSTGEPWSGEGTVVNPDDGAADPVELSIVDELKSQTGDNNVDGIGTLSVTKDSNSVGGDGTEFTKHDQGKRIVIAGATYVIKTVQDPLTITLRTAYTGASEEGLGYALGGKLIGQPWEVKLPTDLIKLDNSLVIK
jgi:hypothetical protein